MPEYTVSVDDDGTIMVDDTTPRELADSFGRRFGHGRARYCAVPLPDQLAVLPPASVTAGVAEVALRVHSVYHRSLTDGPGRRSTLKLQGCSIGMERPCPGCIVPDTHDPAGGRLLTVDAIVDVLADPAGAPRDGYSLLGGEPLDQAEGVTTLLGLLRRREPDAHVVVYSGYTLDELLGRPDPWVRRALATVDVLIDGRFDKALAAGAGAYRGSANQRIYDRPALAAALIQGAHRPRRTARRAERQRRQQRRRPRQHRARIARSTRRVALETRHDEGLAPDAGIHGRAEPDRAGTRAWMIRWARTRPTPGEKHRRERGKKEVDRAAGSSLGAPMRARPSGACVSCGTTLCPCNPSGRAEGSG